MPNKHVDIGKLRSLMTGYIEKGTLDKRVLDTIVVEDSFFPKECELWDYKRELKTDAVSLAETILDIVSFYNTYGGYIIVGVDEIQNDTEFTPYGIETGKTNIQQIKQLISNYTSEIIDISYIELNYKIGGKPYIFGIFHIPKRLTINKAPVFFGKEGPHKDNNRPVFQRDTTYLRILDSCIPATKKEHYQLLFSERKNEYLWDPSNPTRSSKIIIEHNLPNRNMICHKFFGRESELNDLWKWLGDELSNVRILAGEGGKGKTSIAYEFAEEVCRVKPYNIEKVIWLTAKTHQFSGELDKLIPLPRTDFYDHMSLLESICAELAVPDEEVKDASTPLLKKYIKKSIEEFSCLIIIDNIDSIDEDQQKEIFETTMQFPGSQARFLLTTRINKIFSPNQCITVSGFNRDDYHEYVSDLISRFSCLPLPTTQIDRLRLASNGSPLFTESILRLYRTGTTIKQALRHWNDRDGNEVRKAALLHEIEQLSAEAKRVLLATVYVHEASLTELRQITGYDSTQMHKSIVELNSSFLVETKPLIRKEARFIVSENTARLVAENAEQLVINAEKLRDTIIKHRKRRLEKIDERKRVSIVDAAISQARAMINESNIVDAIDSLKSALNENKRNSRLIYELAECYYQEFKTSNNQQSLNEARKLYKQSHEYGLRIEALFVHWFESHSEAKDHNSAIEISILALQQDSFDKVDWLKRKASSHLLLARSLERAMNTHLALDNVQKAGDDIGLAMVEANEIQKPSLEEALHKLDDDYWMLFNKYYSPHDTITLKELFDNIRKCVTRGDKRNITFERIIVTLDKWVEYLLGRENVSPPQINMIQNMLKLGRDCLIQDDKIKEKTFAIKLQNLEKKVEYLLEKYRN